MSRRSGADGKPHPYELEVISADNFSWSELERFVGGKHPMHRLIMKQDFQRLLQVFQTGMLTQEQVDL